MPNNCYFILVTFTYQEGRDSFLNIEYRREAWVAGTLPIYILKSFIIIDWSGGSAVFKHLTCGGSILWLAATISEYGYLLLPSRDMAVSLTWRKSPKELKTNL